MKTVTADKKRELEDAGVEFVKRRSKGRKVWVSTFEGEDTGRHKFLGNCVWITAENLGES